MKSILMLLLCLPIFASDLSEVPEKDLRRQADGGDLHALTELAFRYQEGEIVPFDKPFIFAALTRAAEGGVARAYTGLGLCHAGCIGVALRDDDEAGRYYQMAAEKKDPEGLYYLSRRYREGRSVPMDLVKAQELLEESANLDFRLAKVPLVRASLAGDGVPRDLKALDELILLAEDQKNAPAAYAVGMYYHGDTYSKGVQRPVLARKYLTLAADRRHAGAMLELAKMELTPPRGKKMNANELREARRKASVWYRKAAERNNPERMLRLARLLQRNANLRLEGEDWYRYLLTADQMGNDEATIELADINYHAPEYTYRDLDWSESAYYYQKYLNDCHAANPAPPSATPTPPSTSFASSITKAVSVSTATTKNALPSPARFSVDVKLPPPTPAARSCIRMRRLATAASTSCADMPAC